MSIEHICWYVGRLCKLALSKKARQDKKRMDTLRREVKSAWEEEARKAIIPNRGSGLAKHRSTTSPLS